MDTITLLDLIMKYGLPLVFLVLLVMFIKPKADQLWDLFVKDRTSPDYNKVLENSLKNDIKLEQTLLSLLMEDDDIESVTVFQFHNGTNSFMGIPFLYVTATHQKTRAGSMNWAYHYTNIPISLFMRSDCLTRVLEPRGSVILHNAEEDKVIGGIMAAHKIKSMIIFSILDTSLNIIGLLTVGYKIEYNNEEVPSYLEPYSRIVSGVVDEYKSKT